MLSGLSAPDSCKVPFPSPVSPMTDGTGCHIWVSKSPDMHYWGEPEPLLLARKGGWWDANKIGLAAPPLEMPEGWLLLYHGVRTTCAGAIYRLGLALLDHADPMKVLRRCRWLRDNTWLSRSRA